MLFGMTRCNNPQFVDYLQRVPPIFFLCNNPQFVRYLQLDETMGDFPHGVTTPNLFATYNNVVQADTSKIGVTTPNLSATYNRFLIAAASPTV